MGNFLNSSSFNGGAFGIKIGSINKVRIHEAKHIYSVNNQYSPSIGTYTVGGYESSYGKHYIAAFSCKGR